MKHLTVRWGDLTLFDGGIDELVFTDNDGGIKVEARHKRATPGGKNLLDILASATKPKPAQEETA